MHGLLGGDAIEIYEWTLHRERWRHRIYLGPGALTPISNDPSTQHACYLRANAPLKTK